MKKYIIGLLLVLIIPTFVFAGPSASKVGSVVIKKRLVQGNDTLNVLRVDDPDNPFISIFFTNIDSGEWFALADPSNTSVAARLTGEIPIDSSGKRMIDTRPNPDIAHIRQSIGSKQMKIGRFYDKEKDVMIYIVYSTKFLDGSLKHSLSVVPLGKPLVPQN